MGGCSSGETMGGGGGRFLGPPTVVILVESVCNRRSGYRGGQSLSITHDAAMYDRCFQRLQAAMGEAIHCTGAYAYDHVLWSSGQHPSTHLTLIHLLCAVSCLAPTTSSYMLPSLTDPSLEDANLHVNVECLRIDEILPGRSSSSAEHGSLHGTPDDASLALYATDGNIASNMSYERAGVSRLGAFEVYMVAVGLPDVLPACSLLHSKLSSRRWPAVNAMRVACESALRPALERMECEERLRRATESATEASELEAVLVRSGPLADETAVGAAKERLQAMRQADSRMTDAMRTSRHDLGLLRTLLDADQRAEDSFGNPRPCLSASVRQAVELALKGGDEAEAALRDALAAVPVEASLLEGVIAQAASEGIHDGRLVSDAQKRLAAVRRADEDLTAAATGMPREAARLRAAVEKLKLGASPSAAASAVEALAAIEAADAELWAAMNAFPFEAEVLKRAVGRLHTRASDSVLHDVALRLSPSEAANAALSAAMRHASEICDPLTLEDAIEREKDSASASVLEEARRGLRGLRAEQALREASSPPYESSELRAAIAEHVADAGEELLAAARSALKEVETADLEVKRAIKGSRVYEQHMRSLRRADGGRGAAAADRGPASPSPTPSESPGGKRRGDAEGGGNGGGGGEGEGHGESGDVDEGGGSVGTASPGMASPGMSSQGAQILSVEELSVTIEGLRRKASVSMIAMADARVKQMHKADDDAKRAQSRAAAKAAAAEKQKQQREAAARAAVAEPNEEYERKDGIRRAAAQELADYLATRTEGISFPRGSADLTACDEATVGTNGAILQAVAGMLSRHRGVRLRIECRVAKPSSAHADLHVGNAAGPPDDLQLLATRRAKACKDALAERFHVSHERLEAAEGVVHGSRAFVEMTMRLPEMSAAGRAAWRAAQAVSKARDHTELQAEVEKIQKKGMPLSHEQIHRVADAAEGAEAAVRRAEAACKEAKLDYRAFALVASLEAEGGGRGGGPNSPTDSDRPRVQLSGALPLKGRSVPGFEVPEARFGPTPAPSRTRGHTEGVQGYGSIAHGGSVV